MTTSITGTIPQSEARDAQYRRPPDGSERPRAYAPSVGSRAPIDPYGSKAECLEDFAHASRQSNISWLRYALARLSATDTLTWADSRERIEDHE